MSKVLVEGSSLLCGPAPAHGGTVAPTGKGESYFTVGGSPVLTLAALANVAVSNCSFTTPGGTKQPCLTVSAPTAGGAQALTAGGKPVALDSLSAITAPNGSSLVVSDAKDNVLTAG